MGRVDEIFRAARAALRELEQKLFDHPFLRKVEGKRYSNRQMALLPKEEYHIVLSDLLSAKHLVERFKDLPTLSFFSELVENEEFARQNITALAEALGCSRSELMEHEPDPCCQMYPSYFARLSLHGSEAEIMAAFSSNFSVWWSACKRVAVALVNLYNVPEEATAFLNPFNEVPPPDTPFDELTADAIERGLAQGVSESQIIRAARLIQHYELFFWDALEKNADVL
jgi:thiaminase